LDSGKEPKVLGDGLRFSQSLWAKSENLLRNASHVLGTAEFFLSVVGALLQGKEGNDLAEIKTCHLPSLKDSHSQTELQKKHDWILEKSQKYWGYPEPNHKKSQR
jgi:hypothetical protein